MRLVVVTEYAGDPDDANRTWIDQLVAALEQGGDEARVHELQGDVHTAALNPRSLAGLRRHRADALLYVPFGGLTAAALVRLLLIRNVVPRARAGIAVLYSRKDVPRRLGPLVADIALFATPRLEGAFRHVARRRAVVPPAVDLERFSPVARAPRDVRRHLGLDDSRPLALHVGNFKPHRNVEALAALAREGRYVAMLASPRFAAAPGLVEELRSAGVDVRHEFVADLPQWYRAADVYVFPVADPLGATEVPQTVLEALACGTPVATTRFGALESLFSPEDRPGLVYAAPDELGAAIDVAAKEPRGAGRVLVEGFSSAALAESVRAAYRSA